MKMAEIWRRDKAACVFLAALLVGAVIYGGDKPPPTPPPHQPTPWGRILCAVESGDVLWLVRPLQHFKQFLTREMHDDEEE